MLNLFLSGRGRSFFVLPLIMLVFWVKSFIDHSPIVDSPNYLFTKLDLFFNTLPILKLLLGFVLIGIIAFYIDNVFNNNGYYQSENSLPSMIFVILVGSWTGFHFFSPLLLSLLFLLIGLNRMLKVFHQKEINSEVFDAGFALGMASIIYYPASLFLVSLWIYISMNRAFNFREYFLPLLGMLLPFFFLSVYFFYQDLPYDFLTIQSSVEVRSLVNLASLTQRIFLVISGLAFVLSLPFFIKNIARSKVKTKNARRVILVVLLNALVIYFLSFTYFPVHNREIILFFPMVFILPFYFYNVSTLFQNLLFYFWLISAILFDYIPVI